MVMHSPLLHPRLPGRQHHSDRVSRSNGLHQSPVPNLIQQHLVDLLRNIILVEPTWFYLNQILRPPPDSFRRPNLPTSEFDTTSRIAFFGIT